MLLINFAFLIAVASPGAVCSGEGRFARYTFPITDPPSRVLQGLSTPTFGEWMVRQFVDDGSSVMTGVCDSVVDERIMVVVALLRDISDTAEAGRVIREQGRGPIGTRPSFAAGMALAYLLRSEDMGSLVERDPGRRDKTLRALQGVTRLPATDAKTRLKRSLAFLTLAILSPTRAQSTMYEQEAVSESRPDFLFIGFSAAYSDVLRLAARGEIGFATLTGKEALDRYKEISYFRRYHMLDVYLVAKALPAPNVYEAWDSD